MPSIGETQEGMSRPGPGWLECIGLSVRRDEFPELFSKIGSRHGSLNEAHFNLPSTPYTYIYAGDAASKISETAPSVPGETVDMVPVSVPASPISNVAMEPRPGGARQIGPDDPMPGTRVIGGAPGTAADTQAALARVLPVAEATGAQRVDQLQELAGGQVDEAAQTKQPEQPNGQNVATDSATAQRAAATARATRGRAAE
jgi:hypothetical protein